jgi:hypothetical protein
MQWPNAGWVRVSQPVVMSGQTAIELNTAGASYQYYLLWITSLGDNEIVDLNELTLYR